jgi:hypothetical protein
MFSANAVCLLTAIWWTTVDTTFSFNGGRGEFELVKKLEQWLKAHGKSLFGGYAAGLMDDSVITTISRGNRAEANQLFAGVCRYSAPRRQSNP